MQIYRKIPLFLSERLLKKIDLLAEKGEKDRNAIICNMIETQIFADECRKAYSEDK